MRVLGLSPRARKPLSTSTTLLTSVMPTPIPPPILPTTMPNPPNPARAPPPPPQTFSFRRSSLEVRLSILKKKGFSLFKYDFFYKSSNQLGIVSVEKLNRSRRRSSLGHSTSPTYSTTSSMSNSYGSGHTASFIKSLRASELVLVEPPVVERGYDEFSRVSRAGTIDSTIETIHGSRRPSLTGLRRKTSLIESENGQLSRAANDAKRVSFGHIELNSIDIPKVRRF